MTDRPDVLASWEYNPKGQRPPVGTYMIVERWHDAQHRGVFWLCPEQPCHAIHVNDRRHP